MTRDRIDVRRAVVTVAAECLIASTVVVGAHVAGGPGAVLAGVLIGAVTFCTFKAAADAKPARQPWADCAPKKRGGDTDGRDAA